MTRFRRTAIVAAGVAAAVVLFVVLRPDDEEETPMPANPPPRAATTTPGGTTTQTRPTPKPNRPQAVQATITIRGGRVLGGRRRVTARKGRRVTLVVRADVQDHVHLHGYDLMRDVGPGAPARLSFRATLTGVFEVELEDRGFPIAEIEVRP